MSEAGWKAFLKADGLSDWAVLHGGPTAVYRTNSLSNSAALAQAISQVPDLNAKLTHISITNNLLTIRLTREIWNIEEQHIDLARAVSVAAKAFGAVAAPDRIQEVQVAISAKPDAIDLKFWQAALGYEPILDDNSVDPLGTGSTVWMQPLDEAKHLAHAMHIDVSISKAQAKARVEAALAAGGRMVDDSSAPGYWILADQSGNKVCIVSWPDGATEANL